MRRIAVTFALTVALSTGCTPTQARYQRSIDGAESALARGDLFRAADQLYTACEARPGDPVCERARQVGRTAVAGAVERAQAACAAGNLDACIAELKPARERVPGDAEVLRVFAIAVQRKVEACRTLPDPTGIRPLKCLEDSRSLFESPELLTAIDAARATVATARERIAASTVETCETKDDPSGLETIRCLEAAKKSGVAGPSIESALSGARERSASFFRRLAEGTPSAGASAAAWSVASCLAPGEESRQRRLDAIARLEKSSAVPIRIVLAGSPSTLRPEDLCEITATNRAVRCAASPDAIPANIHVDLSEAVHSRSSATKTLTYKRGERVFVNPAYAAAQDRLSRAERELHRAENEADTAALACERASGAHGRANYCYDCPERLEKELECKAADLAREARSRRASERSAARDTASSTPELLREDENADFLYVETTHRWTATLDTTIKIGEERAERFVDTIVFQDTERAAGPAGIAADPLDDPPRDYFIRGVSGHLRARLPRSIDAALAKRAAARRTSCSGNPVWSPEWLECWAETRYWSRLPIEAAPLLATAPVSCR